MAESSYYVGFLLTEDPDLKSRVAACAQQQADTADPPRLIGDPMQWAEEHKWEYAMAPGWVAKVESAMASDNQAWGRDPAVITDQDILSWTQPQMEDELPRGGQS